jgi:beta-glucosidase
VYRNKLIQETNAIIQNFPDKHEKIHFYDVNDVLENEDGSLNHELIPDYLHPNTEGHRLIFNVLFPEIEKLMK